MYQFVLSLTVCMCVCVCYMTYQRVEHGAKVTASAADGLVVLTLLRNLHKHLQVADALLYLTLPASVDKHTANLLQMIK